MTNELSVQIQQHGFAITPKVIGQKNVAALIQEIDAAIEKNSARVGGRTGYALRHLTQLVPAVKILSEDPAVLALTEPVLGPKAMVVRSLFFDKTPEANWKVAWHQDLTIAVQEKREVPGFDSWSVKDGGLHVQPPVAILEKMLTVRIHLDDCDQENGALQVLPGSHLAGRLKAAQISEYRTRTQTVFCTVLAGGAVLMRPLLLHSSSPAVSPNHRRVIHLEFAADPLPSGLQWAS